MITSSCTECGQKMVDGSLKHLDTCSGKLFERKIETDYIRPPSMTLHFDTKKEQAEWLRKLNGGSGEQLTPAKASPMTSLQTKLDTRQCKYCGQELPLKNFPVDKRYAKGRIPRCNDCRAAYWRSLYAKNREDVIIRNEKVRLANPTKSKARSKLRAEVQAGRVYKPVSCEHCNESDKRIEGHHPDYSKPLEVLWLCTLCHRTLHRIGSLDKVAV